MKSFSTRSFRYFALLPGLLPTARVPWRCWARYFRVLVAAASATVAAVMAVSVSLALSFRRVTQVATAAMVEAY